MSGFDCGSDGSREEEAGCAVLSSGEWNIDVPIVLRWNVAGRPGCLVGFAVARGKCVAG